MKLTQYKFLFLDRDGVINMERKDDYVKSVAEFIFEERALEAISILSQCFEEIFVITNQRGIGRGKMQPEDLELVHSYMLGEITKNGGHVSNIYFCTAINGHNINRKPNVGMAFRAQADFEHTDFRQSVMVGNSKSDIEFGNKLGMYTVLVGNKYPVGDKIYEEVDYYCDNLYKFALLLKETGQNEHHSEANI